MKVLLEFKADPNLPEANGYVRRILLRCFSSFFFNFFLTVEVSVNFLKKQSKKRNKNDKILEYE